MKPLLKKAKALISYFSDMKISVYASHASFFMVLSVFPCLVLLMALLRYTGLDVNTLTELLDGVIPKALIPIAKQLILSTYQNTTGTVISLSVIAAVWSSSLGFYGLCNGLNSIYGSKNRGFFKARLFSIVYTFAFLAVLLLTLFLHVFGRDILHWLHHPPQLLAHLVELRFFLLLLLQTILFTTMYTLLPNRKLKLWDALPGALLSSIGWLIFSDLYSIYVERFAGLSNIFGSVYAVALSMLWLYCCVSIIFFGAALNNLLESKGTVAD